MQVPTTSYNETSKSIACAGVLHTGAKCSMIWRTMRFPYPLRPLGRDPNVFRAEHGNHDLFHLRSVILPSCTTRKRTLTAKPVGLRPHEAKRGNTLWWQCLLPVTKARRVPSPFAAMPVLNPGPLPHRWQGAGSFVGRPSANGSVIARWRRG